MAERLKAIWDRFVSWWRNFTRGQQALIVSLAAVVLVALIILGVVVSRPSYELLANCSDYNESTQITELLDNEGIQYELSNDGLVISVKEEDLTNAHILLGTNEIRSYGFTINDVFDSSFSTTESDKEKKYQLYLETQMEEDILSTQTKVDGVKVTLSIPNNDGTILSQQRSTYVSAILTLNEELTDDEATGLAQYMATAVGDDNTDNILILDSNSDVLFSGGDSNSATGGASSQIAIRNKAEANVKSQVTDILLGSNLYDNVQIGLGLDMDFDQVTISDDYYYVEEGNSQGYLDSSQTYNETTQGGAAAVPGTDSNDEDGTTYVIQDGENSYSVIEETSYDYLPNERLTTTTKAVGTVNPETSTMSVVATRYVVYNQEKMEASGELGEMTFDEFVAANKDMVQTTVTDEYFTLVSNATRIPTQSISIIAYDVPFFQYKDDTGFDITDYLQFILAAFILLLLGFVIFRSTRSTKQEVEIEPELSVESLLESTRQEEALEDIGYKEKSETRILIEKFVDENPEAVANLLRHWLSEDEWG